MNAFDIGAVRFDERGLVAVIVADAVTGTVLTLAYADREALEKTLATGATWLWSRSRAALWEKGATSGNTQRVLAVSLDCDADAVLYRVVPNGPACHSGAASCFSATFVLPGSEDVPAGAAFASAVGSLAQTIAGRKAHPVAGSYTAKLFAGGVDRIAKKIGEEATEVVIAAKNDDRAELVWETADLFYHTLVLLAERGVALDEVGAELSRRAKPEG